MVCIPINRLVVETDDTSHQENFKVLLIQRTSEKSRVGANQSGMAIAKSRLGHFSG